MGFTLIELMIGLTIVAAMAGAVVAILDPLALRARVRDARRIQDLETLQTALELRFTDAGTYPASGIPSVNIGCVLGSSGWQRVDDGNTGAGGSCLYQGLVNCPSCTTDTSRYILVMPRDPQKPVGDINTEPTSPCGETTTQRYNYKSNTTGGSYILTAMLERGGNNTGHECSSLSNWASFGSCPIGLTYSAASFCYGLQNPNP